MNCRLEDAESLLDVYTTRNGTVKNLRSLIVT
jgi:hypothetical protein